MLASKAEEILEAQHGKKDMDTARGRRDEKDNRMMLRLDQYTKKASPRGSTSPFASFTKGKIPDNEFKNAHADKKSKKGKNR